MAWSLHWGLLQHIPLWSSFWGGGGMLLLMSRVPPCIVLVWDAAVGETQSWEIKILGLLCGHRCGPSQHPRGMLMGAGDALRAFVPPLLNLGGSTCPLWLQGWSFGCVSVFFVFVFFSLLSQAKWEPEGEGLPPVLLFRGRLALEEEVAMEMSHPSGRSLLPPSALLPRKKVVVFLLPHQGKQ